MRECQRTTRWSDADLDGALNALLSKSSADEGSLGRVATLIGVPTVNARTILDLPGAPRSRAAGVGAVASPVTFGDRHPRPWNRHRVALLTVAAAVAVAVAVGLPLTLLQRAAAPTPTITGAPLTTDACVAHNLTAHGAAPAPASPATTPGGSPATSWYSPAKAAQLSSALRSALPTGTCLFKGSAWGELTFPAQLSPGGAPQVGMLDAQAGGRLVTAAGDGDLSVSIFLAADSQSCLTDRFDHTTTTADGTVIWQLTGSATTSTTKWIVLLVTAYQRNGTCLTLRLADERVGMDDPPAGSGMTATGSTPLTMEQLTALSTAPGLTTARRG